LSEDFVNLGKLAVSALFLCSCSAFGGAIAADNSYHEFSFGAVGSFGASCSSCVLTVNPVADQSIDSPWTFSGAANIFILDLFAAGDRFELFDNSVSLGQTSVPGQTGGCDEDIACAIAAASGGNSYSWGFFSVGAGSHSLTIQTVDSPFQGGAAVFAVGDFSNPVGGVPEPATVGMMGGGLGLLAALARRIRR
jgi:hypothetical protein